MKKDKHKGGGPTRSDKLEKRKQFLARRAQSEKRGVYRGKETDPWVSRRTDRNLPRCLEEEGLRASNRGLALAAGYPGELRKKCHSVAKKEETVGGVVHAKWKSL